MNFRRFLLLLAVFSIAFNTCSSVSSTMNHTNAIAICSTLKTSFENPRLFVSLSTTQVAGLGTNLSQSMGRLRPMREPKPKPMSVWQLIQKSGFEDFIAYCITSNHLGPSPQLSVILEQYINSILQTSRNAGLLATIAILMNMENTTVYNMTEIMQRGPLQPYLGAVVLERLLMGAYFASNMDAYDSMVEAQYMSNEPILCMTEKSVSVCAYAIVTSDFVNVTNVLWWKYAKEFNDTNQFLGDLWSTDVLKVPFLSLQHDLKDKRARLMHHCVSEILLSSENQTKESYTDCLKMNRQALRNEVLYDYSRLIIAQDIAYWQAHFLNDMCHRMLKFGGFDSLPCPNINLRQREINWLKTLLHMGLTFSVVTTFLNISLLIVLSKACGLRGNRLRPYLLNIATIGTLWGFTECLDYTMLINGYDVIGLRYSVRPQSMPEIYQQCCSETMMASVPLYYPDNSPHQMVQVAMSMVTSFASYTLQACCMFSFVAIGVIQVWTLLWPFKKLVCMDKPIILLVLLWVIAATIAALVTCSIGAINIQNIIIFHSGPKFLENVEAKRTKETLFLTGSADGDSLLLRTSIKFGIASALALSIMDALLASALTVLALYINRSSRRAQLGDTAHCSNAVASRTRLVLVTVIMAAGISCISTIPMAYYLLSTEHLADAAFDGTVANAYCQAVAFGYGKKYLFGRLLQLLAPFANPILLTIRFRPVLRASEVVPKHKPKPNSKP